MERIDETIAKKQDIYNWYFENLKDFVRFQKIPEYISSSYWMVSFVLPTNINREELMVYLDSQEIESRPFFIPIHQMPFYEKANNPNTIKISKQGMNVPSYPQLTKEDVDLISNKIIDYLTK
jgi:perosamine synthetase